MPDDYRTLAIDCTSDENTIVAAVWRQTNVYRVLDNCGYRVEPLTGADANSSKATQEAEKPAIVYITGVSHGSSDAFTGDGGQVVFEAGGYDAAVVRNKIIHFLACNTALRLGQNMVQANGAAAFFGYSGAFCWPAAGDPYDAMFFDCDAEIDRALANGATAAQAGQAAVDKFNKTIDLLTQSGSNVDPKVIAMLRQNRDFLKGPHLGREWGTPEASLKSPDGIGEE